MPARTYSVARYGPLSRRARSTLLCFVFFLRSWVGNRARSEVESAIERALSKSRALQARLSLVSTRVGAALGAALGALVGRQATAPARLSDLRSWLLRQQKFLGQGRFGGDPVRW